jgi:FKBP-type peptidyl-prolyl cis-trans isomerase SlyD
MSDTSPVESNRVVAIHYRLSDELGTEIDSSEDQESPLKYLHGHGQMLPSLERALEGKCAGDSIELTVPPGEAYGERDPKNIVTVPRDRFQFELTPGEVVQAQHANGQTHNFMVVETDKETVTLDGNHPLAGKTLNFSVRIVSVREANEEELRRAAAAAGPTH